MAGQPGTHSRSNLEEKKRDGEERGEDGDGVVLNSKRWRDGERRLCLPVPCIRW